MIQAKQFRFLGQEAGQVMLTSLDDTVQVRVYVLEQKLFRVLMWTPGHALPRVHTVGYGRDTVPAEGFDRLEAGAFTLPRFSVTQLADGICIATEQLRVTIALNGLHLAWEQCLQNSWVPVFSDRATQCYNFDGALGDGVFHYIQRSRGEVHFGLGEKSGDVVRTGRRFRMCNVDCMGYSAKSSDPLYKHIPFYMTQTQHGVYGIYYDTYADSAIDLGCELDNYHGLYQSFWADADYLDYYVFAGAALPDITPRFAALAGKPAFSPRWALGYLGSTMHYTDAPDAALRVLGFLEQCRQYELPCSGFHLSSGYTSIDDKRYVFHWNREKFPDIEDFCRAFQKDGAHLIANIKPCLLQEHPLYAECARNGYFVQNAAGQPELSQFWDGLGSYLDFTNPAAAAWWREQVTDRLLRYGIDTWNDNNEFEIWDRAAAVQGSGGETSAKRLRPLLTLLMLQASFDAQCAAAPQKRPYAISRAGCLGMQRYVQTWTGDNYTEWDTLRYNHKMGLGLSLSGIYNFGHDVGGFAGPKPDAELFLRWIQHGIFMPRFSIHSWNDDQTANEPWMYPEILPQVRELLKLRYRLVPYLYHLAYRACTAYEPVIRPVFYEENTTDYESDLYLVGASMLVANVFDRHVDTVHAALPRSSGWYRFNSDQFYAPGTDLQCPAGLLDAVPVFIRAGSVLPLADESGAREFHIYLPEQGAFAADCFWDDGETTAFETQNDTVSFAVSCTEHSCEIQVRSACAHRVFVWDAWRRLVRIDTTDRTLRRGEDQC